VDDVGVRVPSALWLLHAAIAHNSSKGAMGALVLPDKASHQLSHSSCLQEIKPAHESHHGAGALSGMHACVVLCQPAVAKKGCMGRSATSLAEGDKQCCTSVRALR
jgi:hypothetical protein